MDRTTEYLRRAEQTGHYHPGRGPHYCSRILATHVPELRQMLLAAGTSRRTIERDYVTIAPGVVIDSRYIPDTGSTGNFGGFPADIVSRARAHHILAPDRIVAGWAAAAMLGLPYWADEAPVLMLAPGRSTGSDRTSTAAAHPLRAALRPLPADFDLHRETVRVDPEFPGMRVVRAERALVQCLRSVLSGKHGWFVPTVPGLDRRTVRAVQLIDAFAQCTHVSWEATCAAANGVVSRRTMARLGRLVCRGAESPRETLLRLYVRDVLPVGHRWRTQVTVNYQEQTGASSTRRRSTRFDLACETLRLGLYYDGAHHATSTQTEKDFEQLQDLQNGRWTVVRVNKQLMDNQAKMMGQVSHAVGEAEAGVQRAT